MENTIVSGNRRTFRATLFGVVMLIFGGTALAATAPDVKPLSFTYKAKDANGNTITLENKITTGYEANRVAVDNKGNVYVTDAISNTVSIFNTNGRLVRQLNVNRPSAIGIDDTNGLVYVGQAQNGIRNIHIFNMDGIVTGGFSIGDYPTSMAVAAGYIYMADGLVVRKIDATGAIVRDYGPYPGKCTDGTNDDKCKTESFGGITYNNTRHRMAFPQGIAVDEAKKRLYVSIKEFTETLKTSCTSITSTTATGEYCYDSTGKPVACPSNADTSGNCTVDTAESWMYYKNTLGVATVDSTYRYWNAIDTKQATGYYVLVIDIATGELTGPKKIAIEQSSPTSYNWDYSPKGLALDGKGRLYVAVSGVGTGSGDIRVYDVETGAKLSLNSKFAFCAPSTTCPDSLGFYSGMYAAGVAFSRSSGYDTADNVPEAKGRLFATIGDSKIVSAYVIDDGTNPANTEPEAPVLFDPDPAKSDAVVTTKRPTLKIVNAKDDEKDPLTYAYEVYEIDKNTKVKIGDPITPLSMFAEGKENGGTEDNPIYITSMTISSDLKEESLYSWRAQSFDGELAAWSDEAIFCVDEINTNPTQPDVIKPLDRAAVSPFTSSLSWNASTDPDCANDIVTYEVVVSDSQGNLVKSFSGLGATSRMVSDIPGLISGNTYTWKVRALDNKGGRSSYGEGSFTYMTTSVTLDSDQAGTKVYIDGNYGYYGKLLGSVPVEKSNIAPGSHFVTFTKEGYEPYYAIINVSDPAVNAANSSVTYTATMVNASRIKPSATATPALFTVESGNSSPFVVDYNNDGLKDIFAGGNDGKVYLYLSEKQTDGSVILTAKVAVQVYDSAAETHSDIDAAPNAVPFVVDYDNDGNQDLLLGSGEGGIYLYKGTKDGFVAAGTLGLKDSYGNDLKTVATNLAPAVVDYNNDEKKDLVVGSSDGTLRLYLNTGSDESPEFSAPVAITAGGSDLNVGSNSRAFFADWNSDGKKDLVVGGGSGKASLFFNVGKDNEPEFKSISGLQQWIKEKKKERGNREFIPYLGYNHDLGDLAGGKFEASPFVVDWDGTSARDVIVGNGSGGVVTYITEP